eukprot:4631867-Alexandrium_andersonii.AAC.1
MRRHWCCLPSAPCSRTPRSATRPLVRPRPLAVGVKQGPKRQAERTWKWRQLPSCPHCSCAYA